MHGGMVGGMGWLITNNYQLLNYYLRAAWCPCLWLVACLLIVCFVAHNSNS
jgi:hypothetical protein